MSKTTTPQKPLNSLLSVPEWREKLGNYIQDKDENLEKQTSTPPSWIRFVAGSLGFFSSLLALGIPAIALLIIDRLVTNGSTVSLWPLAGLGVGTAISVCLVDLMRMKALETYFVNVRSMVLYQDSCFALFWAIVVGFIHPLLSLITICVGGVLFLVWYSRGPNSSTQNPLKTTINFDPVTADAVGLGSAYLQQASEGKIAASDQPDFQTIGQTTWLNLMQFLASIGSITICAMIHISGSITLGSMIALVFLNQYIASVFVKYYQVQALKPIQPNLAFLESFKTTETKVRSAPKPNSEMEILSISNLEDFGFAPFSADIFQGLCLTLIGPSGSGKSGILRAIATGQFYEGKITFRDQYWGRNHGKISSLSYAPATPVALSGTIVENVNCFDPQAQSLPAIELLRKLDPFEDVFGDKDFINDSVDLAHKAQMQIVSLARAFLRDSEVLVLDHPEMYLDKASRSALLSLILKEKTKGKIVILATDDEFLMSLSDEVVKLERGEVTDRGPMDEVLERYHQRWVRVSFSPTKREAFRQALWFDAQFPRGMDEGLKRRVKKAAQDMLFFAPRDQISDSNDEILFDVRMSVNEVLITMHDRGDVMSTETLTDEEIMEYDRIIEQTDGFEQTLRDGYRQLAVRISNEQKDQIEIAS